MSKEIKIGRYTVKIPNFIDVERRIDAESLCRMLHFKGKRCDAIIILFDKRTKRKFVVYIEDTGVPEIRDLDKLESCIQLFRNSIGENYDNTIQVKILHHRGGIRRNIFLAFRSRAVEIQRCGDKIDFESIYYKRFV